MRFVRILTLPLLAAALLVIQSGMDVADAQAQFGAARVTFWSSECHAVQLQILDTSQLRPLVDRWRMLETYMVADDSQTADGVGLVNGDVALLELDNGLSPTQPKPIALIWTGQFIGISNGEADTRPIPLFVNTTAVGPFTASEASAVLGARCRAS